MSIDMDVTNYKYNGKQVLEYTNNSPDVLHKVFYHLHFNAFQPDSEMDARLQTIPDPDRRMAVNLGTRENPQYESRISKLTPSEIGFIDVKSLTQNGHQVSYRVEGTILEVTLASPIQPGDKATFDMVFEGQVPVQIRRSGRDSRDGIALSMSQWYPKMAEYDFEGWHIDPYIAREFHGVWGNFDVKITIDKNYILGGTGYLQNGNEIGYGYQDKGVKVKKHKGKTLTWHFIAPQVHDFTWAADPDYIHDTLETESGVTLHFLYQKDEKYRDAWTRVQPKTAELLDFFNKNIGPYPWKQYSVIQGGDGGMEYAMCTLIAGGENFDSLFGTTNHELAHAWFQHLLATNESKHAWMDEGFTSFISDLAENIILEKNEPNPFKGSYSSYLRLVKSGLEQPATTHSDRYKYNSAYSTMAYSKGSVFLSQLGYIIGLDKLMETLQKYYQDFKFKHPTPNDFIRTAEKVSGLQLGWYLNEFMQTTHTIDYTIQSVSAEGTGTKIVLERKGEMPMPIDLYILYNDQTQESIYIPQRLQFGEKENPYPHIPRTVKPSWAWAYPTYEIYIEKPYSSINAIAIDPSELMADVNRENNIYSTQD